MTREVPLDDVPSKSLVENNISRTKLKVNYTMTCKKRLYHLDWIRAVAICMVVLVHICQDATMPTDAPQWQVARNQGVIKVLCTYGISIFFYCCGMAQTFKRNSWCRFVWQRFKRLILTFFLAIFIVLQPTQFISCEYGLRHRSANCNGIYPDTDARGWPEEGEYTSYSYGKFLLEWFKTFAGGGDALNLFAWLWFLPLMFFTDIMNFVGTSWMRFFFEGGWFDKRPDLNRQSSLKSFCGWVNAALEKKDVLLGSTLMLVWQCISCIIFPQIAWFFITYWAFLVMIYVGLIHIRRSKSWFVWWVVKKIIPLLSCLTALNWPTEELRRGRATMFQFLLFANQGYLQQLVFDFEQMHFSAAGKRNCMVINLVFTVFFIALCAPTSGTDTTPFHVPMYDDDQSGLALLATIANWITIQVSDGYMREHYQMRGNPRMYFHFTQFPMILYVFHFFFIVFASNWITVKLVDVWWSYPLSFALNALFTAFMNSLFYALLLRYKITRLIFGLRHFDPNRDIDVDFLTHVNRCAGHLQYKTQSL